ncbi:von Willebrand factor A domain-containing protein 7-like isoform X2 [Sardina pilchardus]|uniref:von Willebrand factor A domain-containing protein 7-like isoform X2 n=1 Tax=Sardina pilchardus TaxID=27697 RepID=UPI002E108331
MKFTARVLLLALLLQTQTVCFKIWFLFGKPRSTTHQQMTETAILNVSAQACRTLANAEGKDFALPTGTLSAESLVKACAASDSARPFRRSIKTIRFANGATDIAYLLSPQRHFDNELILNGRELIRSGLERVKANVRLGNFIAARLTLGVTLHTLQDFYSHSNWIEMGQRVPFSALIKPDAIIRNIADENTPTCRDCDGQNCNNILQSILADRLLTTGYFGSTKPEGKCSHGGFPDVSSLLPPKGGINKDDEDSIHGGLHPVAVEVATAATIELLQDIRGAAGDQDFLRLMGVTRSSSVLCFVIDTTGSMSDDIVEVKRVTSSIIDSRRGTPDEPPEYILVPFNDPDFGPLMRTTNADIFKAQINDLTATGGGDFPEMSLSGLQLALTGAPPSSEIFLFTDATAKDDHLRSTVLALIESTQSVVNCMLTGVLGGARRRRASNDEQQSQRLRFSSRSSTQLYQELAQASGGQAIQVSKDDLPQATSIIEDSTSSALVTIFQAVRNPGKAESFSFIVDDSLRKLTMYVTGSSPIFTIVSPTGATQNNTESSGALGTIQAAGNFMTVRLNTTEQGGAWQIHVNSTQAYTIKVIGQSGIDFLFEFVEIFTEPEPGFQILSGRPSANMNASLLVTVTGESVSLTGVVLVPASGAQPVNTTVEDRGEGDYLVTVDRLPEGEFAALVNDTWEPGTNLTIPFTIASNASGTKLTILARNDRGFSSSFPGSVTLDAGGRAEGTVTLTAPSDTPSGTDVALTIEAQAPGGSDSNYAVQRLTVVAKATDIVSPTCEVVRVNANCTGNCSLLSWELFANLTDGNGTGIARISVRQGSGSLNTSVVTGADGLNVTRAAYRASCCSQEVELVAVDAVGNVGVCSRSIRATSSDAETQTTAPAATTTAPTTAPVTAPVTAPATLMQTASMTTQSTTANTSAGESSLASPLSFWFSLIPFSLIKILTH